MLKAWEVSGFCGDPCGVGVEGGGVLARGAHDVAADRACDRIAEFIEPMVARNSLNVRPMRDLCRFAASVKWEPHPSLVSYVKKIFSGFGNDKLIEDEEECSYEKSPFPKVIPETEDSEQKDEEEHININGLYDMMTDLRDSLRK